MYNLTHLRIKYIIHLYCVSIPFLPYQQLYHYTISYEQIHCSACRMN
jgi:hypothetical protein